LSSCEALIVGHNEQWDALSSMHMERCGFACAAVAKCILVADGDSRTPNGWACLRSAEVFDEVLGHWLRLPCDLSYDNGLCAMGSALL